MKVFGAILCELLGDPKWSDRLNKRANEYSQTAEKITDTENTTKLRRMAQRAGGLAKHNEEHEGTLSKMKHAFSNFSRPKYSFVRDNIATDAPYYMKGKDYYRYSTEKLYPSRKVVKQEKNITKLSFPKTTR